MNMKIGGGGGNNRQFEFGLTKRYVSENVPTGFANVNSKHNIVITNPYATIKNN